MYEREVSNQSNKYNVVCNACLFTSFDSLYIHNLSITMNLHINPHTRTSQQTVMRGREMESACEGYTNFVNPSKHSNVNSSSTGRETEKQWMRRVGCVCGPG